MDITKLCHYDCKGVEKEVRVEVVEGGGPHPSIRKLKAGNERYVNNQQEQVDDREEDLRRSLSAQGQSPWAIVVASSDSRCPTERVFDAKPGDLYVVRVAGNTCGPPVDGVIGSIEYGVEHLGIPVIVVLGHTGCGAVAAALEAHLAGGAAGGDAPEGVKHVLGLMEEPVHKAVAQSESTSLADRTLLAIELNVWHTIEQLLQHSAVIHDAVAQGRLEIQGAVYDLESGRCNVMGDHPQLQQLLPGAAVTADDATDESGGTMNPLQPGAEAKTPKTTIWPTLSWYVQTKHGRQHLKDVVLDRNNWVAGITVALVSVPLSIALGIASGATPMRGLACAIFGGLCSGLFGSSDYNIVGPAGALSGMLMSYTVSYGEDVLPWLSLISSVICLIFALLRLDIYMLLMPTSVFEGFTVGVALIIGLNQINFACGLAPDKRHKLFIMNIVESITTLDETKAASLIVFLITTPCLWFLMRKIPKVPWTVIVPVISIVLGVLCDQGLLGFDLLTLKSKYGELKPEIIQPLRSPGASFLEMLIPSLSIAIVAVLETLISAKIAAGRIDRPFNELKELRGLIVGHAVCGAVGAMPPTGVFVRTSLNTSLGATHRFSQFLNAVVVAIISLAMMPVFSYLPQATIAAILVVASIRMCPVTYLKKLWHQDKWALALCLVTAAICVLEDPVIGLAAGMVLALLARAKAWLQSPFVDVARKHSGDKHAYTVTINGPLTYVNAERFVERVGKLDDAADIQVDLSHMRQADHDGLSALGKVSEKWAASAPDCQVWIRGVTADVRPAISKMPWFTKADGEGRVIQGFAPRPAGADA